MQTPGFMDPKNKSIRKKIFSIKHFPREVENSHRLTKVLDLCPKEEIVPEGRMQSVTLSYRFLLKMTVKENNSTSELLFTAIFWNYFTTCALFILHSEANVLQSFLLERTHMKSFVERIRS